MEVSAKARRGKLWRVGNHLRRDWLLYLILSPGLVILVLFKLGPLLGLSIAFQDYNALQGILHSPWVGLDQFRKFLTANVSVDILHLVKNTVILAGLNLVFTFVVPIVFALFLNEVRNNYLRKTIQTLSFLPYFVSSAVIVSVLFMLLSPQTGVVNQFVTFLGFEPIQFLTSPGWFRPLYVAISVWQVLGYSAVIYLAAITAIDPALYEAASIDGAGRWRTMVHVTLPSISNMIIVVFILSLGNLLSVDVEKILLLYNPAVYDTADVIQTYVYRQAFQPTGFPQYSYAAAVGIIQSVIAIVLVLTANRAAKRISGRGAL